MTIAEKRVKLEDFCSNTPCNKCPLRIRAKWKCPWSYQCPDFHASPESDLDEALKIIHNVGSEVAEGVEIVGEELEVVGEELEVVEEIEIDTHDPVNHPSHYTSGGIECIDAMAASMSPLEYMGYLKGAIIKYVWRYRLKGKPVEDLKKARFYLDKLISIVEKEVENND